MRFGECLPNLFGEGEMTLWFHLRCAAYKRPEPFLEALGGPAGADVPDREALERAARSSLAFRRNTRIDGAERSPTGQARCRNCREPIARGSWRIRIAYFEESRFYPGGFVHIGCHTAYFGGHDVLDQLLHFSASLTDEEREELKQAYAAAIDVPSGPASA